MSELQVFRFDSRDVRTVTRDGALWLVAKDVAEVLGYSNPQKAIRDHCKNAVPIGSSLSPIGVNESFTLLDPQTTIIPERDMYRLVMKSKLPSAEKFEEWVVAEVLPSIRKTGSYGVAPTLPDFTNPAIAARAWADEVEKKMLAEAKILELQPKAEFFDAVAGSTDAVDIGIVAKVLNMGVGRNTLFEILRNEGVLMNNNQPFQRHVDSGYFRLIEQKYTKPDGSTHISIKTVAFQKGLEFIRKLLLKREG